MAEILVKLASATNADSTKDRRGCYKRGDPVVVMPNGHTWGAEERPPKFIVLAVPDATEAEVQQYIEQWWRRISYTVISSTNSTDTHRLRVQATMFNATSGEGKITRAMVEGFLTSWGATVVTVADNAVTFDIVILTALRSEGFWGQAAAQLAITEQSYQSSTGRHRIRINYSAIAILTAAKAEAEVVLRGGTINAHDTVAKLITADFFRAGVRQAFEDDVRRRTEIVLVRRRLQLPEALMVEAELGGGVVTRTKAVALAAMQDKTVI